MTELVKSNNPKTGKESRTKLSARPGSDVKLSDNMASLISDLEKHSNATSNKKDPVLKALDLVYQGAKRTGAPVATSISSFLDGKISHRELQQAFADEGALLNLDKERLGGPVLIPIIKKRLVGSRQDGVKDLFPDVVTKVYAVYDVDNPKFESEGFTAGGIIFVNNQSIKRAYDRFSRGHSKDKDISKATFSQYEKAVIVNELMHRVLIDKYSLGPGDNRDWSKISSGVPDYKIRDSKSVHEFLSDVGSMQVSPLAVHRVLTSSISSDMQAKLTDKSTKSPDYDYTHKFIQHTVDNYLQSTQGLTLEGISKAYTDMALDTSIPNRKDAALRMSGDILGVIGNDGVKHIQEEYLKQGRTLVKGLSKNSPIKGLD